MNHSWTEQELWVVCVCYKENLPIDLALRLTNTHSVKSMQMRYGNCLFLDKGKVEGSVSHPSKNLVRVWNEVTKMYSETKDTEESCIVGMLFIMSLAIIIMSIIHIAIN